MPERSRFTINADLFQLGDPNVFAGLVNTLDPDGLFLINDPKRCAEFASTGRFVWYREYNNREDLWNVYTPKQMVDRWQSSGYAHTPNFGFVCSNEPHPPRDFASLKAVFDWFADVGYEAASRQIHASLGHWFNGFLEKYEIEPATNDPTVAGVADKYLRMLDECRAYIVDAWHYGGLGLLPFTITTPYEQMYDIGYWNRANWPTVDKFPQTRKADGSLPDYWLTLRATWLDLRSALLGLKPARRILSEFTVDWVEGDQRAMQLANHLKNLYGAAGQEKLSGFLTYRGVYGAAFPNETLEAVVADQCAHVNPILPDNIELVAMYANNFGEQWRHKYNFEEMPAVYQEMHNRKLYRSKAQPAAKPTSTPIPPDPTPIPPQPTVTRLRVNNLAGLNVRATPNGALLGTLMPGETCTMVTLTITPLSPYLWVNVDTRFGRGWVAHQFVDVL